MYLLFMIYIPPSTPFFSFLLNNFVVNRQLHLSDKLMLSIGFSGRRNGVAATAAGATADIKEPSERSTERQGRAKPTGRRRERTGCSRSHTSRQHRRSQQKNHRLEDGGRRSNAADQSV